jgi:hypothetical protein
VALPDCDGPVLQSLTVDNSEKVLMMDKIDAVLVARVASRQKEAG